MNWHLITCEYPPRLGGVSDHTRILAEGLAAMGDRVDVWCPAAGGGSPASPTGVFVRPELGRFSPLDLRRAGRILNASDTPRHLLVQWVPHGYGYHSLNIWFCLWVWARAHIRGDEVTIIVHEPFLAFGEGSWQQTAAAVMHRLMVTLLLLAARRVWTTIPQWEKFLRPYALGRRLTFGWLPVPSTMPVVDDAREVAATRAVYCPTGASLIGHFGTYGEHIASTLNDLLPRLLLADTPACAVMLMGRGGEVVREELVRAYPSLAGRVHATGVLTPEEISHHLAACDLLVQPYPDGVSTRRTSIMAGLAHGLPVATTKGALTEELWEKSDAVSLAPAGDGKTLLVHVLRLLESPASRAQLAASARALYRDQFDVSKVIASLRNAHCGEAKPSTLTSAGATLKDAYSHHKLDP